MRKVDLPERLEAMLLPRPHRAGGPFADAVQAQHRRVAKRRGVESRGGVREMMLGEQQRGQLGLRQARHRCQFAAQFLLQEQLVLQPHGHGRDERTQAPGSKTEVGFEQALELQQGFVVENDRLDGLQADAGILQAPAQRRRRKGRVVTASGEALFLRGIDNAPVQQQRRGTVMVVGRQAEDVTLAWGQGAGSVNRQPVPRRADGTG